MEYKKKPEIAVLLAAYNGMRWIGEQIETIFNQEGVNLTIFISVDLSNDGTYEWVKKLEIDKRNVVVLPYGERFGGAGPNFFRLIKEVDFSTFDAVSFADQDDIWEPDKLIKAYTKIESGQCDVYSSNVTAFWPDGTELLIVKSQPQRALDHFFEAAGPGCTYVFSKASIKALKEFIMDIGSSIKNIDGHDSLSYAFCREREFKWFIDEWSSMRYRQHENNQSGTNKGFSAYKKRFKMISNKWLRNQVDATVKLVSPEKSAQFSSRIFLIVNFYSFRRRFKERYFLLLVFILGIY